MPKTGDELLRFPDFLVTNRNLEEAERAKRLRMAVKASGGNQAIATRSGTLLGTLNRYLSGSRDMKVAVLVPIARACGVTVEWLATGEGPMKPDDPPPVRTSPAARRPPGNLSERWDIRTPYDPRLLAKAADAVLDIWNFLGIHPTPEQLVMATLITHNYLEADPGGSQLESIAKVATVPWIPPRPNRGLQIVVDTPEAQ